MNNSPNVYLNAKIYKKNQTRNSTNNETSVFNYVGKIIHRNLSYIIGKFMVRNLKL